MKKLFYAFSTIIIGVLFLISCSTVSVATDYDTKTDFNAYKTFAFYKPGIDKAKISDLDKKRILRAIERELLTKGLTKSSTPDVLVSIFAKSVKKVNVYRNNGFYPYYYGPNWGTTYSRYTEGTLFIDLIDPNAKSLIWQGTGKGALNTSGNVHKKEERVNEFVKEILDHFPPEEK